MDYNEFLSCLEYSNNLLDLLCPELAKNENSVNWNHEFLTSTYSSIKKNKRSIIDCKEEEEEDCKDLINSGKKN